MDIDHLVPEPAGRNLRIFAFDPGVAAQYDTAGISEIVIRVAWEKLEPGPIGEYVEVVDVDPASGLAYPPVQLNDERILAQNGLPPSEANPQFHQQMVYAVAMATIGQFEQALGRVALWAARRERSEDLEYYTEQFVRRLRIYPHAIRDRNAYYSPAKKAVLFGYFPVGSKDEHNTPGTIVFTCLSHDIIAHEVTHALLDGVHPRFNEPVNGDVFAFHEAFADIVALFQHFSYPGVLRDQIARTRGDLGGENLLGQLAQQFGRASGRGRALRNYLGNMVDGRWVPLRPDVQAIERANEPHARGAILVAAVFGAFLKVYRARTADLYRIASEGTGQLKAGAIHPDLAGRLADEAARAAQQTLQMCIRAIDYCPPVGITFGDYLRAVITADADLNPDDPTGHRLAFIESFRQWGIHPANMRSMSVGSLMWPTGQDLQAEHNLALDRGDLQDLMMNPQQAPPPDEPTPRARSRTRAQPTADRFQAWNLDSDRLVTWRGVESNAKVLWSWLMYGRGRNWAKVMGIVLDDAELKPTVFRSRSKESRVAVEVHSVRTAIRRSQRGAPATDLVVEITQRRRGYFDPQRQAKIDSGKITVPDECDFVYRAGCTLLINPSTMDIRRVIRTAGTIVDDAQLGRMREFLKTGASAADNAFYTRGRGFHAHAGRAAEPFCLLHNEAEG